MNVKYLDSNVFLQSALYIGVKTDRAKAILESIAKDESSAATSSLAMDEVVWVAMKEMGDRKKALILCKSILEIPNLKILDVTGGDILKALWFMEKYSKLKPRDAIHLAVCFNAGIFTIISDDSDFNDIEEITRESLE